MNFEDHIWKTELEDNIRNDINDLVQKEVKKLTKTIINANYGIAVSPSVKMTRKYNGLKCPFLSQLLAIRVINMWLYQNEMGIGWYEGENKLSDIIHKYVSTQYIKDLDDLIEIGNWAMNDIKKEAEDEILSQVEEDEGLYIEWKDMMKALKVDLSFIPKHLTRGDSSGLLGLKQEGFTDWFKKKPKESKDLIATYEDKIKERDDLDKKIDNLFTTDDDGFSWSSSNPFSHTIKSLREAKYKKKLELLDDEIRDLILEIAKSKTLTVDELDKLVKKFPYYLDGIERVIKILFSGYDENTPPEENKDVIKYYMDQGYRVTQSNLHWDNQVIRDSEIDFLLDYDETYINDFGKFMSKEMQKKWGELSRGSRAGLWGLATEAIKEEVYLISDATYEDLLMLCIMALKEDDTASMYGTVTNDMYEDAPEGSPVISYDVVVSGYWSGPRYDKTLSVKKDEMLIQSRFISWYTINHNSKEDYDFDIFINRDLVSVNSLKAKDLMKFERLFKTMGNLMNYQDIIKQSNMDAGELAKEISDNNDEFPQWLERGTKGSLWGLKQEGFESNLPDWDRIKEKLLWILYNYASNGGFPMYLNGLFRMNSFKTDSYESSNGIAKRIMDELKIADWQNNKSSIELFVFTTIKDEKKKATQYILNELENDPSLYLKYKEMIDNLFTNIPDWIKRGTKTGLLGLETPKLSEMHKLNESPDALFLNNIEYLPFKAPDAKPFMWYQGKCYVGDFTETHTSLAIKIANELKIDNFDTSSMNRSLYWRGRFWEEKKVMTFWDEPPLNSWIDAISQLEKASGLKMWDNRWKVEIYDSHPDFRKFSNDYSNTSHGDTKLIPVEYYDYSKMNIKKSKPLEWRQMMYSENNKTE